MRQSQQQRRTANDEAAAFRTAAAGMQRTADAMTALAALLVAFDQRKVRAEG